MSDALTTGSERLAKRFNQPHLYAADIKADPGVKALVANVSKEAEKSCLCGGKDEWGMIVFDKELHPCPACKATIALRTWETGK